MMGDERWAYVSENLRRLRRIRRLSQAALAAKSRVAKLTVSNIERGHVAGTSLRVYAQISDALNVPLWVLLESCNSQREVA